MNESEEIFGCQPIAEWKQKLAWAIHAHIQATDGWDYWWKKLQKWNKGVEEVIQRVKRWQAQRSAYAKEAARKKKLKNIETPPPKKGWHTDYFSEVRGYLWCPPELLRNAMPPTYEPCLPLPDRELTLPEQYVVLAALHDEVCKTARKIARWPEEGGLTEMLSHNGFVALKKRVKKLATHECEPMLAIFRSLKATELLPAVESEVAVEQQIGLDHSESTYHDDYVKAGVALTLKSQTIKVGSKTLYVPGVERWDLFKKILENAPSMVSLDPNEVKMLYKLRKLLREGGMPEVAERIQNKRLLGYHFTLDAEAG